MKAMIFLLVALGMPLSAMAEADQKKVVMSLTVNEQGQVEKPVILTSNLNEADNQAAINKVKDKSFEPVTKNNEKISFRFVKQFHPQDL